MTDRHLLTTKECADMMRITPRYLLGLIRDGKGPPHYRLTDGGELRFLWSDVLRWVRENRGGTG